jgi:hypothetical protein
MQFVGGSEMSDTIYVLGGVQRAPRKLTEGEGKGWYEYEKGLLLRVDPETLEVETALEYVSPPETCAAVDPQVLFKSAVAVDGVLYASTQTEVILFELPSLRPIAHISLPCFNDVHHVRPTPEGTLLVANSGLDMALEITLSGEIVRAVSTLGEDPWERFPRTVDYRMGVSTKPHRSHPNHVFYLGEEAWATRFEQRDAISLDDPRRRIALDVERVHDGLVHGDRIYFTSVDGKVLIADPASLAVDEIVDLNEFHDRSDLLGWCRGIAVDGDLAWVGFSRIRATKIRENVGWIAHGMRRVRPTHIALYDLARGECVCELDLEQHGLSAVFSVLPVPGRIARVGEDGLVSSGDTAG